MANYALWLDIAFFKILFPAFAPKHDTSQNMARPQEMNELSPELTASKDTLSCQGILGAFQVA